MGVTRHQGEAFRFQSEYRGKMGEDIRQEIDIDLSPFLYIHKGCLIAHGLERRRGYGAGKGPTVLIFQCYKYY